GIRHPAFHTKAVTMTRPKTTQQARSLRTTATKSEGLLWSILRSKQVSGLKFRRQHPIGRYIADFACLSRKLVIEIDGPTHDITIDADLRRENFLRARGWDVIRFEDDDVREDPEAVARAIANHLGMVYEFRRRSKAGSGLENVRASNQIETTQTRPSPERSSDPPSGG
ncbi:MAG: endonuclease domain-containing protein, partial [Planctomycetaceae bacterium]